MSRRHPASVATVGRFQSVTPQLFAGIMLAVLATTVGAIGVNERRDRAGEIDMTRLETGDIITVTGPLAVYGNEPNTFLALEMDDASTKTGKRLVQLEGEMLDALFRLQGQRVMVTGVVTRLEIGPGFPTIVEVTEFSLEDDQ